MQVNSAMMTYKKEGYHKIKHGHHCCLNQAAY